LTVRNGRSTLPVARAVVRFLVKLDQDVEIVVKPHRNRHNAPALHVS
jgi:hypothetical protein